jgi:Flp pilus assembly protein protease CpaA
MLVIIQQIAVLLGTLIGGVTDAKTGYIFDWITYPMIILGVLLSLIQLQWFNLVSGVAIFLILFLFYKFGKLGGGDVKIFTGIAFLNPFNEINFVITLIFFAAIFSMLFYSIFYTIKYIRITKSFENEKKNISKSILLVLIIVIYFATLLMLNLVRIDFVIILGLPLLGGAIYIGLQDGIKKNFFDKKVSLGKLEEDEIPSENNSQKILKLLSGKKLVGKKEIQILKKNKIKELIVLRNLPKFGPFIFLGTIIAIINPAFFVSLFI